MSKAPQTFEPEPEPARERHPPRRAKPPPPAAPPAAPSDWQVLLLRYLPETGGAAHVVKRLGTR